MSLNYNNNSKKEQRCLSLGKARRAKHSYKVNDYHCCILNEYLKQRCFIVLTWETYIPKRCCVRTDFIPLIGLSILTFLILLYWLVWAFDNFQVMISFLSINQLKVKCCLPNDFVFRKIPEAHDKYTLAVVYYIKIMGLKLSAPKHHVRHGPHHVRCKKWNGCTI